MGKKIKTSSYNQSHEGSRRFKNKHPTARIFSRGAHSFFPYFFFFVKVPNVDILFSSNHKIHKSSCGLCFWASDPSIDRFY